MTVLTAAQRLDRVVTEDELLSYVLDLAAALGWRSMHIRPAWSAKGYRTPVQGDGKGFPDIVLVHPHRGVIFAELKRECGSCSKEQTAWLHALERAGQRAYIWRPSDRALIGAILSGGRVALA